MRSHAVILSLVALLGLAIPAAALAVPPVNDDYLKSFPINAADTRVPREEVKAVVDTTEATTQPDLFVPGTTAGGGPEKTTCNGRTFGKTVWYDLHPDVDGSLEIQTGGFDVAITLYEFDNRSAKILRTVGCAAGAGTQDFIIPRVEGGRHYTIQVGGLDNGAGPLGGVLALTFQFFADRDGDNVFDPLDDCPDQPGVRREGGCPPEVRSTPKLTAAPAPFGVTVRRLSVSATKGSKVEIRCRRGCSGQQARTAGVVSFSLLRGRALPAGARIEIFVTKAGWIGSYTRYDIVRGNFKRTDRCLKPGSHKPRKKCT
ncbi:MAG: hypothetical protein ACXWZZ_12355 [Solirubrobacteraceae bacterium]